MVRLFDYSSDEQKPWSNCDKSRCSFGDRLTGSIINRYTPSVYSLWDSSNAGIVLRPRGLKLSCSYSRDGVTYNIQNGGCPESSCTDAGSCGVFYCGGVQDEFWWKCAWQASQLAQMMTMHERLVACSDCKVAGQRVTYNEIVIETRSYFGALPYRIEGFFHTKWANEDQKAHAKRAHAGFVRAYSRRSVDTPLMVYDPDASAPFTMIAG